MKDSLFNIKEIVTVVMAYIEKLEEERYFGFSDDDNIHFPKNIKDKLLLMHGEEKGEFEEKCREIAEEVFELRSGELNELNFLHQEIGFLAENILEDYIIR